MKVGDIVKFKNGRSYYGRRGYGYVAHKGYPYPDHFRTDHIQIGSRHGEDLLSRGYVDKPFPVKMRGKLAIITKMDCDPDREAATEVCMITHDPYGNGDKIVPLPNPPPGHPNLGTDNIGEVGFIEGLDLEVISSGADQ